MPSNVPARSNRAATNADQLGSGAIHPAAGSAAYRRRKAQSRRFHLLSKLPGPDLPGSFPSFDEWIQRNEAAARSQFFARIAAFKHSELGGWFARMLEDRFLPTLEKIGFNSKLARPVMAMAAPAWKSMGPLPASGFRIHPGLTRKIEEIRRSIQADTRQQAENRTLLSSTRPAELYSLAAANADPAKLNSLLEKIAPSWLILPRAYRTLDIGDSICLPVYLSYLDGEQDPEFRKALSRVTIEFIGNFTRKHHRSTIAEEKASVALFFGVAAMFWENLRRPPAGRQNDMIWDHFFRWAQRIHDKTCGPCEEMDTTVAKMSSAREQIFPQPDAFGRMPRQRYNPEASLIALRSGEPGMASVLGCLGPSTALFKDATAARIPYSQVPAILQSLLRTFAARWTSESHATCHNIRRFLCRLADRYRFAWKAAAAANDPAESNLRFTAPRTIDMIHSFTASLS